MKQKTLGEIFAATTVVMTFGVSVYVLYYRDVTNFNTLVFCLCAYVMMTLIPLFMFLFIVKRMETKYEKKKNANNL